MNVRLEYTTVMRMQYVSTLWAVSPVHANLYITVKEENVKVYTLNSHSFLISNNNNKTVSL